MGYLAKRIRAVLQDGPRKQNVLVGLARDDAEFERAVGQLFLLGLVVWRGRTKGRRLALRVNT